MSPTVLIASLQNAKFDPYRDAVVYQAVWALGQIKDVLAVQPIQELICNTLLPEYVWEAANRALCTIGGCGGAASVGIEVEHLQE